MEPEQKIEELSILQQMQKYLTQQFVIVATQHADLHPFARKKTRLDHANTLANICNAYTSVTTLLRSDDNGPSTPEV